MIGCLDRLESTIGRKTFEALVRACVLRPVEVTGLLALIRDIPFQGYITLNYDSLIERCFEGHGAWVPVGNTDLEARKISNASEVIWHFHGAAALGNDRSHLVITQTDYDDLYLEDNPILTHLKSLLLQRRLVIIGFGFRDPEVLRILKRIGRLANPARPIFAFVGGNGGTNHSEERRQLLEAYNIDVIPYDASKNHKQLNQLLGVYGSLVLRRSLRYNNPARPCPSYDPETTGILLYNELCLRNTEDVPKQIFELLIRARVIALLRYGSLKDTNDLIEEVKLRAQLLKRHEPQEATATTILAVLAQLRQEGLIAHDEPPRLTELGANSVAGSSATSERMAEQFSSSIENRCLTLIRDDRDAALRVAKATETFLKDCIKRKALGVAMARTALRSDEQKFHMVALLQTLPEYMSQLHSDTEAIALSSVVQSVIASPEPAEASYVGLLLQAQFGAHLLGVDPPTLSARARNLADTLFVLDSSVVIHLLARASTGFGLANSLLIALRNVGCVLATTPLLIDEVAEHARYAITTTETSTGVPTAATIEAATGSAGVWLNAFVDGFLVEFGQGKSADIRSYLSSVLTKSALKDDHVRPSIEKAIKGRGIQVLTLSELRGFLPEMYAERDDVQEMITKRREQRGTYKKERQVKAEAEVNLLIRHFRDKQLGIDRRNIVTAYFVSHTGIIDDIPTLTGFLTMKPEALLQWASALRPCNNAELGGLTESLLWELKERDVAIIDRNKLRTTFQPLIDASRDKLADELERHQELIAEMYGSHAEDELRNVNDLSIPIVVESLRVQQLEELRRRYELEKAVRIAAQAKLAATMKDQNELDKLRAKDRERQKRSQAKKRAAASRKKPKTKKGKNNKRKKH